MRWPSSLGLLRLRAKCQKRAPRLLTRIHAALNRCSFLVVVPGFNHEEGKRMLLIVVAAKHPQRVIEGLSAACAHLAVLAPACLGVVEPGPRRAHRNLVGIVG